MLNNREKLIELLLEVNTVCRVGECEECIDDGICFMHRAADNLIENGVTVQKKGEWKWEYIVTHGVAEKKAVCSLCGVPNKQYMPPYCPHCGAKMDGDSE